MHKARYTSSATEADSGRDKVQRAHRVCEVIDIIVRLSALLPPPTAPVVAIARTHRRIGVLHLARIARRRKVLLDFVIVIAHELLLILPRLPIPADHARAVAPLAKHVADALVRDGEEVLFGVFVNVDEVQAPGLGVREAVGAGGDEAFELRWCECKLRSGVDYTRSCPRGPAA